MNLNKIILEEIESISNELSRPRPPVSASPRASGFGATDRIAFEIADKLWSETDKLDALIEKMESSHQPKAAQRLQKIKKDLRELISQI